MMQAEVARCTSRLTATVTVPEGSSLTNSIHQDAKRPNRLSNKKLIKSLKLPDVTEPVYWVNGDIACEVVKDASVHQIASSIGVREEIICIYGSHGNRNIVLDTSQFYSVTSQIRRDRHEYQLCNLCQLEIKSLGDE